ncbi:unnamed protein product [Lactuca virosa]|uniref:Uncharacterized protein n=1 Tax=Lactuca virosa TaxID=75947 RepID=A0AAU9LST1_9ASTR|nr:unnamed protein product [Lactuca virosa]
MGQGRSCKVQDEHGDCESCFGEKSISLTQQKTVYDHHSAPHIVAANKQIEAHNLSFLGFSLIDSIDRNHHKLLLMVVGGQPIEEASGDSL